MKNLGYILISLTLLVAACGTDSSEEATTTEIQVVYPEIPLCDKKFIPGDTLVWQNFQMRNITPVDWYIYNIEVRGNSTCAFKVYREPFVGENGMQLLPEESSQNSTLGMIIPYLQSTILRIEYTPSEEGVLDFATLVITSNAQIETYAIESEQIWPEGEEVDTDEESEITKIFIPMCGAPILPIEPDAGISEEDAESFLYECPVIDPSAIGDDFLLCGHPLPEDSIGCQ